MTKSLRFLMTVIFALTMAIGVLAQKPGSQPAQVNLDVVIDDLASQGLYGFGSDGSGAYINGTSGVTASFLSTGVLSFNTGNRTATAFYSSPITPDGALLTGSTTARTYFLTFVHSSPALYLQTMGVGTSRCEGLIGRFPISSKYTRNIGYRAGHGTLTDLGYMLVTRTGTDTWVMDSNSGGVCGATAYDNVARIIDAQTKGPANDIVHGRYYMPLRLVLTRH